MRKRDIAYAIGFAYLTFALTITSIENFGRLKTHLVLLAILAISYFLINSIFFENDRENISRELKELDDEEDSRRAAAYKKEISDRELAEKRRIQSEIAEKEETFLAGEEKAITQIVSMRKLALRLGDDSKKRTQLVMALDDALDAAATDTDIKKHASKSYSVSEEAQLLLELLSSKGIDETTIIKRIEKYYVLE